MRTQEFFGVFIDWLLAGDRISFPQTLQKWYSPKSCCKCQSQEKNTWLLFCFWESQLQIVFQDYIHISKINIFHDISSIKKPGNIYNFDTLWFVMWSNKKEDDENIVFHFYLAIAMDTYNATRYNILLRYSLINFVSCFFVTFPIYFGVLLWFLRENICLWKSWEWPLIQSLYIFSIMCILTRKLYYCDFKLRTRISL